VTLWFISDTHFFHSNILRFTNPQGELIRPGFSNIHEMNEKIVDNWNAVVRPDDHVYHLGDVTFRYDGAFRALWLRLKGKKRLVVGNHDKLTNPGLMAGFEKIMLWRHFADQRFLCTHLPIREDQFRHNAVLNLHGHIHERIMDSQKFLSACVEQTGYRPISMDEIVQVINDRNL
jgi:calcineurin-like phosphoesterase family protein